ncbi:acyclic terpene utilization AtuA family protein [Nocardioides limicola]|uniref:acyclic terpene utilization AtuA family protein n=1 Tax=Nocardioides limicola TaxID=2803368 RepID=UPI00193C5E46|nr:acyclic terpene utilization AtuA family protein [Nocardioides sp. DJM-14]
MTLRIGNCSGFYGDRLSAMREMLTGGPLDVLTGDYLAELTMLILGKDTMRDANLGYARTFVRQAEDCLGEALERKVRIVSNAGGLNPAGLAEKLREVAQGLGLDPVIAHVEGDDLKHRAADLGWDNALTANAYLGGHGIAAALGAGADVVVTGRVTDASVVVGPAIWHHGWGTDAYDELAGAVVAGHILECGTQAVGGNFSGFVELIADGRINPDVPLGFPLAEINADGSSVITKHPGTGGAVTVDTVTAQLLYEIQSSRYLGPDVTTHLDTIQLSDAGDDRVLISGVKGSPPPATLKVSLNELGGWRNSVELVVTGLHLKEKADWVRTQLTAAMAADPPAVVDWSPIPDRIVDAATEEAASARLRCTVLDPDMNKVGKAFTSAAVELALGSYPGFTLTAPPAKPSPYGVFRPVYVDRELVSHVVVLADGTRIEAPEPAETVAAVDTGVSLRPSPFPAPTDTITRRVPLGSFVHARSGDKGGDANLGLWVVNDGSPLHAERVTWLTKLMNPRMVRELIPEAADLDIEVHVLPNLGGVNVLIRGLLGEGVAASTRFDPQAKGLGEWVLSRLVNVEGRLL